MVMKINNLSHCKIISYQKMTIDNFLYLYPLYKKLLQVIWHLGILEFQKEWVWNDPLELVWSNPPAQGGVLEQTAQDHIQLWFQYLQRWRDSKTFQTNLLTVWSPSQDLRLHDLSIQAILCISSNSRSAVNSSLGRTQYESKGKLWKRTGWEAVFNRKKNTV